MIRILLHNYLEHLYPNSSVALIEYEQENSKVTVYITMDTIKTDIEVDLLELIAYTYELMIG